jgi:hypothetical protein
MNTHNIPTNIYHKYLESAEDLIAYGFNYGLGIHELADRLIEARINRAKEQQKVDRLAKVV